MRCYRDGQDDEKGVKDRDRSRGQKRPVLRRVSQRTLRRVTGSASVIDTEDLPSTRWSVEAVINVALLDIVLKNLFQIFLPRLTLTVNRLLM